ncbi:MAG TPA: Omp28-related outer membrane protein [bacterium]
MVIAYHANGYPYYCADGVQRWSYYGWTGTPYVSIDGLTDTIIGGISYPGNMFPFYRIAAAQRMAVASPMRIILTSTYDTLTNNGSITAKVKNDSTSSITAYLYYAVVENDIDTAWYGMTGIEHVCRDMLPTGTGTSITIPAGDSITNTQAFTINAAWKERDCKIVVFTQNNSTKRIYQGAEIVIVPKPIMKYWGLTFTELSKAINRVVQPGEMVNFFIKAKNIGGGVYNGTTSVSTSDAYVSIASQTSQTVALATGDVDTVLVFQANISASCPSPRTVPFKLQFGSAADTMTYSFIVTNQPGFSDNMDVDTTKWAHGPIYTGGIDFWHRSTYRYHSSAYSWYSGREATHLYGNRGDAALTSIPFVVTPDSSLKYWRYYNLELNWDYSYVEIDNNSGNWQTLLVLNGSQTSWAQQTLSMANYYGQTVRLRFRFMSDASDTLEGLYIDDVQMPVVLIGVDENKGATASRLFSIGPNPCKGVLNIAWDASVIPTSLKIYDVTGRLVKFYAPASIPSTIVTWHGEDDAGRQVPAGTYFVEFEHANGTATEKALLLR